MTTRRALVNIAGVTAEMPDGDALPYGALPVGAGAIEIRNERTRQMIGEQAIVPAIERRLPRHFWERLACAAYFLP